MKIEYVASFLLPQLSTELLGALKPLNYGEIASGSTGIDSVALVKIPVASIASVAKMVENNNVKVKGAVTSAEDFKTSENLTGLAVSAATNGADEQDTGMDIDEEEPQRYVDISSFKPRNFQQQIATLSITGLPNVKKWVIEHIIGLLSSTTEVAGGSRAGSSKAFTWTTVNSEHADSKVIFVRFDTVSTLGVFVENFNGIQTLIGPNVKMFVNAQCQEYITPQEGGHEPIKAATVEKLVRNPLNIEKTNNSTGTEDLDAVLSYYSSYKVEESELVDVPNDMKSGIVKDIIKFRSKVLKIEKERRKREIEKERLKAKLKLKRLFQDIQKERGDEQQLQDNDDVDDETEAAVVGGEDDLSDGEYDELIRKREAKAEEDYYLQEARKMRELESFELRKLRNTLSSLENYESDLMENKIRHLEELRRNSTSTFKGLSSLYFTNYSEYLRNRNVDRAKEEKLDRQDEEDAVQEGDTPEATKILFNDDADEREKSQGESRSAKQPEEAQPDAQPESEAGSGFENLSLPKESVILNSVDADISSLPPAKLEALKSKIADLIEEYLGLKEETLIEFVYNHLYSHNLSKKDSLVAELSETLDDDAEIVVNEISDFLLQ